MHATADDEHEAALELLLLVMIADRHISVDEIDEIAQISDDSELELDTFSFDQYLGKAMAKVRAAVADGTVDELLDDIDDRIASRVLRPQLFAAARDVADVDQRREPPRRHALLAQHRARFG